MRALLVANPSASAVTDARRRVVEKALEAALDIDFVRTEQRGHAAELAADAVAMGAKAVIAYGGDGTVHEVVNGLLRDTDATDVVLGILPGGGTNVLARNLGYPNELVEATAHLLDLIEQHRTRRIGAGRLHADGVDRVFVIGCGLCLDAETVRLVEETGLRPRFGDLAFLYCGLRAFFRLRSSDEPPLVVETPDGDVDAWWASIAGGDPFTYWGRRGLHVAPGASYQDGIALTAGRSVRLYRTLSWLRKAVATGRHVEDTECIYLPDLAACSVRSRVPVPLQADGEFIGMVSSVRAVRLPRAFPVFA